MNEFHEISRGPWLIPALLAVEALIGLLALRNTRQECRVRAVRSAQTVAAVWACFLLHSAVIALAAWNSAWVLPIPRQWGLIAGGCAAALGLAFAVAGFWEFRSLQRMSGLSSDHLVTTGIYRFSRNPQNLGWGLMLLGIALAGRSGLGCLLALGYWAVFRHYVATEEKHLAWVFSSRWDRYVARTPRFLSLAPLWKRSRAEPAASSPAPGGSKVLASFDASRASEPLRYWESP